MQALSKNQEHSDTFKDALSVKYISHFRGQLKNSIFLDTHPNRQNKLIYPSANTIAFNTLSASYENQKTQSFIMALAGSKGITCIAQSQNKRFFAWAQDTELAPVIFLIDLNDPNMKRKSFAAAQIKGKKIISLAFNGNQISDPKCLAALTSGPDYQIIQWNYEKGKYFIHALQKNQKVTIVNDRFTQIFFYREEDNLVAMGKQNLKFFKVTPQKLILKDSPFARREVNERDYNFTAYCIMKQSLIVGTQTGDLLYFSVNGQFKAILFSSPGENYAIETLLYLPNSNKSFLVGGSQGMLFLYQKSDSKDPKSIYVKSDRKFPLKQYRGRITSLATTTKQNDVFLGFHNGIILKMTLQKNEQSSVQHAIQSFHTDNITGLDVSLRKPLIATCSTDRSVRVWNFLQKNTLEVVKYFEQKPLSLSFHPSGLHLIVSFPDKVRLINILENQLISYKDLPIKNCYQVKFSNGGHLFAVVNNVMVQVFNFYTLDQPPHYQFKAQTGKFQTMSWDDDDLAIYLGTSDGYVYFYKLEDPSIKLQILAVPGLSVKTIASTFVGKDQKLGVINQRTVYASGTFSNTVTDQNKCIYQVKITPKSEKDKQRENLRDQLLKYNITQKPNKIYTYSNVSKIAFLSSKKAILYSSFNTPNNSSDICPPSLRYSRYPFNTKQTGQIQAHLSLMNRIISSPDDNYVFSVGQQGQFIIYEVRDKDLKVKVQLPDYSQQFLYSKPNLIQNKTLYEQLKSQNMSAKEKRDRDMRQSKAQNQRLINQWHFKINQRQKLQKERYQKQVEIISQMQKQQIRKLSNLQVQNRQKRFAVEKDYADKIHLQQTRFSDLGRNRQSENKKFNQLIQTLKSNHAKAKQDKQKDFRDKLTIEKNQLNKYQQIYTQKKEEYQKQQQQAQSQAQKLIKIKKQQNETVIKDLTLDKEKAQVQKRAKKQSLDHCQRQLQQQNHKLKHTHQDIQKIKQKHQENLQKKQSQAKQIQQRQKTIRDKMTRINQLKKKTQQLQKFKFVLDYKIKELKRDIGPREEQIAKMKQQISNMNSQIIHFRRTNDNMNLIVKDLVSKRNGMDKQAQQLSEKQTNNSSYIKSFQYDVSQIYQNCINDYKILKSKIVQLHRKYVQQQSKKKMDGIDQQKQFIKERQHLQSTVKGLKQKFKKSIQLHQADNKRIMSQNQELISEINDLKRQKKNLRDQAHKQELMKQMAIRLQEQRIMVQRQYENTEKTLRQLKGEYQKRVKRKREAIQG